MVHNTRRIRSDTTLYVLKHQSSRIESRNSRCGTRGCSLRIFLSLLLISFAPRLFAQEQDPSSAPLASSQSAEPAECTDTASPLEQTQQQNQQPEHYGQSSSANNCEQPITKPTQQDSPSANQDTNENQSTPSAGQQPKRILGVMPNFRAVSAKTIPPPPTPKESFKIATQNSFDYSSFVFVGITSLLAEGTNAHPQLGKGIGGYGRYYWRGFVDKADGDYFVIFALPSILHQDERYYAMGQGGFWKRATYSATRIFVTPDYHGHNTFNASELLGRGISQGISLAYYPSQTQTFGGFASKFGYAIGRDMLTNVFREFWPDIAKHVLHRNP